MYKSRNIPKYNQKAKEYSENIKDKGPIELVKTFKQYIPEGSLVLDVACAAGRDSRILKDLGYEVVGIDLAPNLLTIAKRENPDIKFKEQDALKMSFEEKYFDGILAIGFIHELARNDVPKFISECNRVLKKGGFIIIRTKEGEGEQVAPPDILFDNERINTLFSEPELNSLFHSNGFSKITSYVEDGSIRKNMRWLVGIYKKI